MHSAFKSNLPYAKYVKLNALGQWYWDPGQSRSLILAAKLHAGAAQLYGESPAPLPFTRRFFAGGSMSVRGWSARTLAGNARPDTGGSTIVETSVEARWSPLRDAGNLWFFETKKLSFVFFYDAGNVWSGLKQVTIGQFAMAAGLGVRYETIAGPIRFDFGWKVFDPEAQGTTKWITGKRFVADVLPNFVFHFGVGPAF